MLDAVFTIRKNKISIITASALNKKHYRLYEKEN